MTHHDCDETCAGCGPCKVATNRDVCSRLCEHAEPVYAHDCDQCQSLGRYSIAGVDWDLYYCPGGALGGSVQARYGDDAASYQSMDVAVMVHAGHSNASPLVIAVQRQIARWRSQHNEVIHQAVGDLRAALLMLDGLPHEHVATTARNYVDAAIVKLLREGASP